MNILRLKKFDKNEVIYEYQPEGKGHAGEILFDLEKMEAHLLKAAEMDSSYETYGNKAISKVVSCIERKNLPLECIQAWY